MRTDEDYDALINGLGEHPAIEPADVPDPAWVWGELSRMRAKAIRLAHQNDTLRGYLDQLGEFHYECVHQEQVSEPHCVRCPGEEWPCDHELLLERYRRENPAMMKFAPYMQCSTIGCEARIGPLMDPRTGGYMSPSALCDYLNEHPEWTEWTRDGQRYYCPKCTKERGK